MSQAPPSAVFVVSVAQHGMGGHYHSLAAIAGALFSERPEGALIVTIGVRRSPVVDSLLAEGFRVEHIGFEVAGLLSAMNRFTSLVRGAEAHVIHAFDEHAFLFARVASVRTGVATLLTKCGGPVPKGFFPKTKWLSVFSEEDAAFFVEHGCATVWHIPNRVRSVAQDEALISELRQQVGDGLLLVRVTRIAPHYAKTLQDSMRLAHRLRRDGIDAKLIIIGHVYDRELLANARAEAGEFVYFFTEERFCRDAKRVIGVAELVIGTGRSLMEAVVLGKTVLCPVRNMEFPCLLTPENVGSLAATNFSERGCLSSTGDKEYHRILERCRNGLDQSEEEFLRVVSAKYCDVAAAVPRYRAIYNDIAGKPEKASVDMLVHAAKVVFVFTRLAIRRRLGTA